MNRLSNPLYQLRPHYDVVVVGSGYGGAITASRLARAGKKVCVLERGREFAAGDFPNALDTASQELQVQSAHGRIGKKTGLYDLRLGEDIHALVGCGLGGTSLINANVAVRPSLEVFDDDRFPAAFRAEVSTEVETGFVRAEHMLGVNPLPVDGPDLPKLRALERCGRELECPPERVPLAVSFEGGENVAGVVQKPCTHCGDCVSGCNYEAKNTLDRNYLPDAKNHGADIYTGIEVHTVHRDRSGWRVSFRVHHVGRTSFSQEELFIRADVVVLAAGTLGSTEILLRSAAAGLSLSSRVGERFSGNGDVLGFCYNADHVVRGVGFGDRCRPDPVGPCIVGWIDKRSGPLEQQMVIEDGVIPGALAPLLPGLFSILSMYVGKDTDQGVLDRAAELLRVIESKVFGARSGAMLNTLTFLVMAHDDARGRIVLHDERAYIEWPGVGDQATFERIHDALHRASRGLGGTYDRNPLWGEHFGKQLVTVHPLGGCAMAETGAHGVVDHKGRVFSGAGEAIHDGLYVTDGAVLPRSIGANPLLTISAISERCVAHLARDRGWSIDYETSTRLPARTPKTGLQFTERMQGDFVRLGHTTVEPFSFLVTIGTDDLDRMLDDPAHRAHLTGTVRAPGLSPDPLTAMKGYFHLFSLTPDREGRQMRYQMPLYATDGRVYWFDGVKDVKDDPGFDIWRDTTTLAFTLSEANAEATGPRPETVMAEGQVSIQVPDLLRQVKTFRALAAPSPAEARRTILKFLTFFSKSLVDVYVRQSTEA